LADINILALLTTCTRANSNYCTTDPFNWQPHCW